MNGTERAMYDFWGKWFAQPLEEKMEYLRQPGRGGYYPPASESPGFTGKPDPKEYAHVRVGGLGWEDLATRQVFMESFIKAQCWLEDHGPFASLLDTVFLRDCVLRIIHYPPSPEPVVGQAHKDFDLLTVSVEGTAPGLEVQTHEPVNGDQVWVQQETGIQIGEMLTHYTHDRFGAAGAFAATTHRVRTEPNTDRLKAVFFYLPPNDFELRPGFTAGDYLKDVLSKAGTYGIRAK